MSPPSSSYHLQNINCLRTLRYWKNSTWNTKVILLRCFPQKIFILLPKMIPTSPHADTGHECSDGFLSHSTSSYLVQLKSSGNSSGLLWYLILTILPSSESLTFIFEISFLRSQLLAIPRWSSSRHSAAHPRHHIQVGKYFFSTQNLINTGTHPFYIFLTF